MPDAAGGVAIGAPPRCSCTADPRQIHPTPTRRLARRLAGLEQRLGALDEGAKEILGQSAGGWLGALQAGGGANQLGGDLQAVLESQEGLGGRATDGAADGAATNGSADNGGT